LFKNTKNHIFKNIAWYATTATALFLIVGAFGEGPIAHFASNTICNAYINCTVGFLGYDAIEHFLSGVSVTLILIWIFKKFPTYSLFTPKRWKNILILLALVISISVLWEIIECAYDIFRFDILVEPSLSVKLHLNILAQPTNLDTMGDLIFGAFGALLAVFFIEI
jgi:uncharacterized membrane protein YjdF